MSEGKANVVHVALSVYDPSGTYSRFAGVVMTSLFSNTRNKVNVTILHDATLSQDNQRRFRRTAERWGQGVSFIDASQHIFRLAKDPDKITYAFSRGALFRLLIPSLMNEPKVIYLDCDIVVNLDIAELWNVPLEAALAAVKDQAFAAALRRRLKKIREWAMPYDPKNYFNSGVLVMNLSRIRAAYPSLVPDFFRFAERYSLLTEMMDQDFLNVFFRGDVLLLDKRFNNMLECEHVGDAVLHLTDASSRPWRTPKNTPRDRLFWKTLAESEWSDALMEALIAVYDSRPLSSYRTLDCAKLLFQRLQYLLSLEKRVNGCVFFFKDLFIVLKELGYRIRRGLSRAITRD
ncbi:MAG: glycosyltransferase family 8 protein [Synergistaceae bacterium]|jgi:lipopolysaccharide biosynthesis glycosyltransferase|nr:glycosyltransferase family 8 protein [Synergistaceae bacterium]